MSSESSAVVRFIHLAQQHRLESSPVMMESTAVIEPSTGGVLRWLALTLTGATLVAIVIIGAVRLDAAGAVRGMFAGDDGAATAALPAPEPDVAPLTVPASAKVAEAPAPAATAKVAPAPAKATEAPALAKAAPAVRSDRAAPAVRSDRAAAERRAKRADKRRAERAEKQAAAAAIVAEPKPVAEPAVAASEATGVLMLGSKPPCDIYIDGKKTGLKTPQRSIELPAGAHVVTLVNREFRIKDKFKVIVKADEKVRKIRDLSDRIAD